MSSTIDALLAELDDSALDALAERFAPRLAERLVQGQDADTCLQPRQSGSHERENGTGAGIRMDPAHNPVTLSLQRRRAAAALGVSVDTFDRYIRPLLKCVYVGDTRLWPVVELQRYLEENARRPCDDEPTNIKRPPRRPNARGPGTRR